MFEVNIRFIGGLLAAYYLSGQEVSSYVYVSAFVGEVCFCRILMNLFVFFPWSAKEHEGGLEIGIRNL